MSHRSASPGGVCLLATEPCPAHAAACCGCWWGQSGAGARLKVTSKGRFVWNHAVAWTRPGWELGGVGSPVGDMGLCVCVWA